MNLRILHQTKYEYSSEVFIEPHILRFKPKSTGYCRLQSFKLRVLPNPLGISEHFDLENNTEYLCWFDGLLHDFGIIAESELVVEDYIPFNFLIYPNEFTNLPFKYKNDELTILKAALSFENLSPQLIEFGQEIRSVYGKSSIDFITNLTRSIYNDFDVVFRKKGKPREASETFRLQKGSCRDLAWMEIQMLRYMGIASRFVSGYYYLETDNSKFELHAWLEAYLPGAGWIGIDPSHGILTGNLHIPVCQSAYYENTMPVSGSLRGDATSNLHTELKIIRYE